MSLAADREVNRASTAETRWRRQAVRARIRARNIDDRVLLNSSDWVGGHVLWYGKVSATKRLSCKPGFPA
jgi:hypothetical protein